VEARVSLDLLLDAFDRTPGGRELLDRLPARGVEARLGGIGPGS
jgi:hypothetical protein